MLRNIFFSFLVFLGNAFCSSFSFSQEKVISEFVFSLSREDYNSINENVPLVFEGESKEQIVINTIAEPYKTVISPIKLSLNYQVQTKSALNKDGRYPFFAYILQPKIEIDNIHTEDVITERIGNLIVNVNVRGYCQNLVAQYRQAYIPVKGYIQLKTVNGQAELMLESFDFSYNSSFWGLNFSSCSGPKGYDEVLKNHIRRFLDDKIRIANLLEKGLKNQVSSTTVAINEQILRNQKYDISKDLMLELHPHSLQSSENQSVYVYGWLALTFKNHKSGGETYVTFKNLDLDKSGDTRLILPSGLSQVLMMASHNNDWLKHTVESNSIEGLSELTKSRFKQFFAWPDLMNFSKKTNFIFDIYSSAKPNLQIMGVTQNYQLLYSLESSVVSHMFYPENNKWTPYVNFYSNLNSSVIVEVTNVGLRVSFSDLKAKSSYNFDSSYVYQRSPNEYIDVRTLEKHLISEVQSQKLDFNLGPINLNYLGEFYPKKFNIVNDQIELIYAK